MNTKAALLWLGALMLSLGCDVAVARDGGGFGRDFHGNAGGFHGNAGGIQANVGGIQANVGGMQANAGGVQGDAGGVQANAGGFHGNQHFENHHGGMHMSDGFHDGRFHDGRFHHFHGHRRFFISSAFFWPPIIYGAPAYPDNSLIYVPPSVDYSYYCTDPAGYYPVIQTCPTGWLRVTPDDTPEY